MNLATGRRASVIALAASILLLSGCGSSGSNSADPTDTATASPSKSPTPSNSPSVEPAAEESLELAFGSAEDLVEPEWHIEWTDPFVTDDGFAVLEPDDGAGSWSYTDVTTKCEILFYQGQVLDLDWTKDDRVVSNQMLAILAMGTPTPEDSANVTANAGDFAIGLEPEDGEVHLSTIGGAFPDGRSLVHAVRMFGALSGGITVTLVCPPGIDASSEFVQLSETHLSALLTR